MFTEHHHAAFLSTPSARRATCQQGSGVPLQRFLSTPSARRATWAFPMQSNGCAISIHALREEGDSVLPPRTPHASYFYPRPPRGGRRQHAGGILRRLIFLSTPSARRATPQVRRKRCNSQISIHALREEGDLKYRLVTIHTTYFYPRPPRGGRPQLKPRQTVREIFLSTPSARRATALRPTLAAAFIISIHALREEGDLRPCLRAVWAVDFYPRPPRGGRLSRSQFQHIRNAFLSTPSARRATLGAGHNRPTIHHFYPRPPRGGRHHPPQ